METITIPSPSVFLTSPKLEPSAAFAKRRASPNRSPQPTKPSVTETDNGKGNVNVKPKQSKSRNGCVTCKAKRLKCDETKPSCKQCHKRNVSCGGYKKDFKWRSFEEGNFVSKPSPAKARKISKPDDQPPAVAASKVPASDSQEKDKSRSRSSTTKATKPAQTEVSATPEEHDIVFPSIDFLNDFDTHLPETEVLLQSPEIPESASSFTELFNAPTIDSNLRALFEDPRTVQSSTGTAESSPHLLDGADRTILGVPPGIQSFDFEAPHSSQNQRTGPENARDDEDVEEIAREPEFDLGQGTRGLRLSSPASSSTSSSSTSSSVGRSNPMASFFNQPEMHASSPEMLILRYDRETCGILSVKDGPSENPWRTLIWPLARDSPALYHAIISMTAFHASKNMPILRVKGVEHMQRSVLALAAGLEGMRTDVALATTLVLAFSESFDQHISTGIKHLRGAKILVDQILNLHRARRWRGSDLPGIQFLCNAWVYLDVIALLTSLDGDDVNDFEEVIAPFATLPNTAMELDPLMGCATTLFPLIGHAANLIRRVRNSASNSIQIVSQAMELKSKIEAWQPPTLFEPPEDPTSEISHSLQTAEAYRWATLLYLHQAVPEIPSLTSAELSRKVLVFLATVPLTSRTLVVQIYPLMAAGCEVVAQEDRQWVRDRWSAMARRMLIGNIDRGWEVMEEVWLRRDRHREDRLRANRRRRIASVGSVAPMDFPPLSSAPITSLPMRGFKRNHHTSSLFDDGFSAPANPFFWGMDSAPHSATAGNLEGLNCSSWPPTDTTSFMGLGSDNMFDELDDIPEFSFDMDFDLGDGGNGSADVGGQDRNGSRNDYQSGPTLSSSSGLVADALGLGSDQVPGVAANIMNGINIPGVAGAPLSGASSEGLDHLPTPGRRDRGRGHDGKQDRHHRDRDHDRDQDGNQNVDRDREVNRHERRQRKRSMAAAAAATGPRGEAPGLVGGVAAVGVLEATAPRLGMGMGMGMGIMGRGTSGFGAGPSSTSSPTSTRTGSTSSSAMPNPVDTSMMKEDLEYDFTVRGRLHWVGVMRDWKWEVLLG
ncbi:hypothetical protein L228DRAFT_284721 [Xylona heveae TC161]|uniref:Zn(2)-C6 fungal-type domain-containing protein n=1 Tax=Xylona heveae (strain CBS 132557 / TC161) TaxID=1328760 RepID=A0A165FBK8_XYLHT|nr:hypothetical protein L228DRAFT_284721 [Xylona heveae TC161]KZF20790.1 hypothetical protein L228DRAFT_284721 [Xylona heveae TC161]